MVVRCLVCHSRSNLPYNRARRAKLRAEAVKADTSSAGGNHAPQAQSKDHQGYCSDSQMLSKPGEILLQAGKNPTLPTGSETENPNEKPVKGLGYQPGDQTPNSSG